MHLFLKSIFLFCMFCSALQVEPVVAASFFDTIKSFFGGKKNPQDISDIFEEVDKANMEQVRKIVLNNPTVVHSRDQDGKTPLHYVRTTEMARLLLEYGADIRATDKQGNTPLHTVKTVEAVEVLLARSLDQINVKNKMESTPLLSAIKRGYDYYTKFPLPLEHYELVVQSLLTDTLEIIRLFLQYGGRLYVESLFLKQESDRWIMEFVAQAVSNSRQGDLSLKDLVTIRHLVKNELSADLSEDILKALDARIANENLLSVSSTEINKIFYAVERNDIEEVRKILSRDNRLVHITGVGGETPLHTARTAEMARLLLDHGANVDEKVEKWEYTPLKSAAVNGYSDVAQTLLKYGADVYARSANNESIISAAVFSGHSKVVQVLLDRGVDVHIRDWNGNTLLHIVATSVRNPLEVLKLLLDHGAKVDAKNMYGRTPLHEVDTAEIARLLLDHGADVNVRDQEGRTPLYRTIMYFLEVGPRIDPTSEFYDRQHYQGIIQIVRTLIEYGAKVNVEVSFTEREENNIRVLNFVENVSQRRQDGLSVEDIKTIKQLVMNEVGKLKPASVLKALDARIAEEKQKGSGGSGGTCPKSFE